jgi:anaerobic ribonucleoside-triphosphate reductase activating protein
MQSRTLNIAGFDEDGIADGPGLRCVLFVQGCPHHCPGCQNPQTWDFEGGTQTTVQEVYERIRANLLDTGVTFSGGEPFAQPEALADLAEMLHPHYDLACYTGYTWEGLLGYARGRPDVLRLLRNIDILVDGPFIRAKRDPLLLFRGSSNQRIIDVKTSLKTGVATWTKDPNWIGEDGTARAETF